MNDGDELPAIDVVAHIAGDLGAALADLNIADGDRFRAVGAPVPNMPIEAAGRDDRVYVQRMPTGPFRARFDETEQLVICHPEYDGFVVANLQMHANVERLRLDPSAEVAACISAHQGVNGAAAGQLHPIDVELHPGQIARRGVVRGELRVVDAADDSVVCEPLRLVLATAASVECELAGRVDGPLSEPDFDALITALIDRRISGARAARRVAAAERRDTRPAWKRWLGR